jgi:hypothetical protein
MTTLVKLLDQVRSRPDLQQSIVRVMASYAMGLEVMDEKAKSDIAMLDLMYRLVSEINADPIVALDHPLASECRQGEQ